MRRGGILLGLLALVLGTASSAAQPTPVAGIVEKATPAAQDLDSRLVQVADALRQRGSEAALRDARESGLAAEEGLLRVIVEATPGRRAGARTAIEAAGGRIEAATADLLQALVPIGALSSLDGRDELAYVRPPLRAEPAAVTGEGVGSSGVSAWLGAGFRGAGVKVAVIDLGFSGLPLSIAAGEVPTSAVTVDFCPGRFNTTEHGTAVAEIVHETAPEAQLHLICIGTEVELAQALDYVKRQGIQIVNHSVAWFGGGRGDGSGPAGSPADTVAKARASEILWVNAAGNAARRHWSGAYVDSDNDGWHEYSSGDESNAFTVPETQAVCVDLKWDAWPATSQDFDLYLLRASDSATLARSTNLQDGSQAPYESLCWWNPGTAADVTLAVARARGTTSPRLDLFASLGILEHRVAAGSVVEPATSPHVLSVGAVCWQDSSLELFSSQGPTIDGRTKPDLVGPDNVSSSIYGDFASCGTTLMTGFKGTSAAAPFVAGAAAVVKQRFPSLTTAQLQAYLEGDARDLGAGGKDSSYGAGSLWLEPGSARVTTGVPDPAGVKYANVTATVDPNGLPTTYWAEYGSSRSYGSQTPAVDAGGATGSKAVSVTIEGLQPNSLYHYRVAARNAFGITYGTDATFATLAPGGPTASTGLASPLVRSAAVQAVVNPNGEPTTFVIEYGQFAATGTRTAAVDAGRGVGPKTLTATLTGLAPGTTYYYRVIATNSYGMSISLEATLVTLPGLPPAAATGGASVVGQTSATVGGSVDPKGEPTTFYVQYGTSPDYGGQTGAQSAGGALGATQVSASLDGLGAGTVYHYRLVAVNAFGTSFGADSTFTTEAPPSSGGSGVNPSAATGVMAPIAPLVAAPNPSPEKAGLALRRLGKTGTLRAARVGTEARVETGISLGERARVSVSVVSPRGLPRVLLLRGSRVGSSLLRARRAAMTATLAAQASAIRLRLAFAALRPGKTYWIRIIAVDAAGERSVLMVPFRR